MQTQKSLEYLNSKTSMTLREGIQELRTAEGIENDAVENVAPELVDDLNIHDAIHVLFACPTTLPGEISAHLWKVFGTTMKMKDIHRVNRHEDHRQVLAEIGYGRLIRTWFKSIPSIVATLWRSLRLKRCWPAKDYELFLDVPLVELRQQFGIHLPSSKCVSNGRSPRAGAALRRVRPQEPLANKSA